MIQFNLSVPHAKTLEGKKYPFAKLIHQLYYMKRLILFNLCLRFQFFIAKPYFILFIVLKLI